MARPSRARRILKWIGVALSLLIMVAWTISVSYDFFITLGSRSAIGITQGRVVGSFFANFSIVQVIPKPYSFVPNGGKAFGLEWPVYIDRNIVFLKSQLYNYYTLITLPFWLLLLPVAIPTAWLWHRDRRRIRPGHCLRCGYDLTGNKSGVCSECGLAKAPSATV